MLRIEDAAFAAHVRAYVDGEVASSTEVTEQAYRKATGPFQRVRQLFAYLLVGVVDTFGKVLFPAVAGMLVYLLLAAMLLWKPEGLFKPG